jgi:hypothetical protein
LPIRPIVVDSKGTVYCANVASDTVTGLSIGSSGAIEVDRSGNIILVDTSAATIDLFPAGQTSPSKQITVSAGSPYSLALTKNEDQLYVSVDVISVGYVIRRLAHPNGSPDAVL